MASFNWLHLTDLHYGLTGQSILWPNIRDTFFNDLARLHDGCGPWHAVLFSGDLVQSGTIEEFNQLNQAVLEPLWEKLRELGSGDAVLLAVPGNHDILRPDAKKVPASIRQLCRHDCFHEIAEDFWNDPNSEYRAAVSAVFSNYVDWWKKTPLRGKISIQDGLLPGDFSATLELESNSRIGIVGLNTTFRQSLPGNFKGQLIWGARQSHVVCDEDVPKWIGDHNACILMTHQGPEWLDGQSNSDVYPEINPAGRFAVHLFGHMHENVIRSTTIGGGKPLRQWQGCSLFGMEKFGEPPTLDRRHGYSLGRIEFSGETPTIRHWPRRAVKDSNGWRFERDTENCVLNEADGGTNSDPLTYTPTATNTSNKSGVRHRRGVTSLSGSASPLAGSAQQWSWPHSDPGLKKYCEGACKAHSHIRFVEVPYLKDVSDVELDNLYVEPCFSSQEIHPDSSPTNWPRCVQALHALRENRSLVLLGDPGSGKSTLISCLTWQLCRPQLAKENLWANQFGGCVPLPMVLRELHLKADLTWEGLLDAFLEHHIGKLLPSRKVLESLLKDGRAIILLDGLDEIGNLTIRRKLRDAVHAGMTAHPDCRWILTSRMVGYTQVPFHFKVEKISANSETKSEVMGHGKGAKRIQVSTAALLYLAPFNDQQIGTFSMNWYTQHEKDSALVENSAQEFVRAIQGNDGTQRLARIPFLLTLMALIHHKNARLPHGRTELYERIATAYLESIDVRRKLDQLPYSLAQKKRWLADVAFQMQLRRAKSGYRAGQGDILATKTEVRKWLRSAMAESGTGDLKDESETLLNYFAERSGLLLPRGDGKFGFMHLSLQEYFAACFLEPRLTASRFSSGGHKVQPSDEELKTWANSEAWSEAFLLLFELVSEKSTAETEGFLDHLFMDRLEQDQSAHEATAAGLLAELSTDPFVLLSADTRRRMRQKCWRWTFYLDHRVARNRITDSLDPYENKVVRSLVRESKGDLEKAWKAASIGRAELAKVESLDLSGCTDLLDLRPIGNLRALKHLSLDHCNALNDLTPLSPLSNLKTLTLEGCPNVVTIEAIRELKQLEMLVLGAPVDLSPLANVDSLADLHLHCEFKVPLDLSPLAGLPELIRLCILEDSNIRKILISDELRANPEKILSEGLKRVVFDLLPQFPNNVSKTTRTPRRKAVSRATRVAKKTSPQRKAT